jgi:pimeloyl-ACP methyl ester carboxylesterase
MFDGARGCVDYAESGGDGATIVLVPGSCSTGAAWRPIIAQLGDSFRCVTTSLLGYGGTAERRAAFDADISHEAELVEAVIRRAPGPVHLVGHSFGGLVALAVAQRNRVKPLSLVIIEAPAVELLRYSGEHGHYRAFRAMTRDYFAAFHAGERTAIGSMIDFYGGPGTFAAWPQRVRDYAIETTSVNILDWACAYGFELTPASLASIEIPTLVLLGAASPPAMQRANALVAQCIEDASVITVAGAAHFMIATHAEEVAWAIAHHVARTELLREPAVRSSAMFAIPMHNRFAEGFGEAGSSGETLGPLSARIAPPRLADADFDEVLGRARAARSAALGAMLVGVGRGIAAAILRPPLWLFGRLAAWRRRERAAMELYSVDERTLADLGLRRCQIPFILAQGGRDRLDDIGQRYPS